MKLVRQCRNAKVSQIPYKAPRMRTSGQMRHVSLQFANAYMDKGVEKKENREMKCRGGLMWKKQSTFLSLQQCWGPTWPLALPGPPVLS